ncbi:MAG: hypothetical protein WCL23_03760 [Candidatus Moraniibacteriota bacterium]
MTKQTIKEIKFASYYYKNEIRDALTEAAKRRNWSDLAESEEGPAVTRITTVVVRDGGTVSHIEHHKCRFFCFSTVLSQAVNNARKVTIELKFYVPKKETARNGKRYKKIPYDYFADGIPTEYMGDEDGVSGLVDTFVDDFMLTFEKILDQK